MKARLSVRWLVGVVVMVAVVVAVWALWPSKPRAEQATGWQTQTDLPMLVFGPRGIAVGRNGDVYVVESEYIQWLPAGRFIAQRLSIPELKSPYSVAIGPADELYVSDYRTARILKISADRKTTVALPFTGLGDPARAGHSFTAGVAVDRVGTVFAIDPDNSRILELPAGSDSAEVLATVEHLRSPIAVSDTGDVVAYVSDPVPALLTFRGGKAPAVSTPIPDLKFVDAITIDHRGNRLLADNAWEPPAEDGSRPSKTTAALWLLAPGAATPIRLPYTDLGEFTAITVDASDTIYYIDSTALGRVVRLSPVG
jgi:DNA-binding beta-propeller fold protein YncE